jgi:hypothetical protein
MESFTLNIAMFRWLWPSYDRQRTQEEQWVGRRKVKEQLAIAANIEAEWEAMTRKWEANDCRYEDCDLDYQTKMRGIMRDVSCIISCQQIDFVLKLWSQAAVVTGQCLVISGQPQPVTQLVLLSSEIYLRRLSPEEQAEYRKTLPDFELKIQDRYSGSNSTKKD